MIVDPHDSFDADRAFAEVVRGIPPPSERGSVLHGGLCLLPRGQAIAALLRSSRR